MMFRHSLRGAGVSWLRRGPGGCRQCEVDGDSWEWPPEVTAGGVNVWAATVVSLRPRDDRRPQIHVRGSLHTRQDNWRVGNCELLPRCPCNCDNVVADIHLSHCGCHLHESAVVRRDRQTASFDDRTSAVVAALSILDYNTQVSSSFTLKLNIWIPSH